MWRSKEIQENGEQLNFFVKYQRVSLDFLNINRNKGFERFKRFELVLKFYITRLDKAYKHFHSEGENAIAMKITII